MRTRIFNKLYIARHVDKRFPKCVPRYLMIPYNDRMRVLQVRISHSGVDQEEGNLNPQKKKKTFLLAIYNAEIKFR